MADRAIFRITSVDLTRQIASLHMPSVVGKIVQRYAQKRITQIANLARDAAQSAVPIHTGELRQAIVVQGISGGYQIVVQDLERQDRRSTVQTEGELADLLDKGTVEVKSQLVQMKRSQSSISSGGFPSVSGYTSSWVALAQKNLLRAL